MQKDKSQHAISPLREEDFPEWYQQVLKSADLAENSPVRGCMVIKPWGYGIWERIQSYLDGEIKRTGHQNAYFPLFIPLSFLQREAQHVEGFAKECAVVTHHRLEMQGDQLVPAGELEEPLIVRPTSEMIIGESFSKWIESYRDLPLLINQWCNVVRWEMRTRIFLRTTEFLWQEGHTAHATEEEAKEETLKMLEVYRKLCEEVLAVPVILGQKTEGEKFPGASATYTIEAMMQDRKAIQGGTSHFLGQNFARGCNIQFTDRDGEIKHPYTTSWGVTTRLVGGVIMAHGDDDGLRLPPRIAPYHVVIIPVIPKAELEEAVLTAAKELADQLSELDYHRVPVCVHLDKRDLRGGEKNWDWIKKGVPVRIEIGPRDLESGTVMVARRDHSHKEKRQVAMKDLIVQLLPLLDEIQANYLAQAKNFRKEHTCLTIENWDQFKAFFTPKNPEKPEIHGGFVRAKWCGDEESVQLLEELKVTIRCLPLDQDGKEGKCVLTGKKATLEAIFAKAY